MAYLNVRERRIEATIAYVGSELAGKGTNVERIARGVGDVRVGKVEAETTESADLLSFAWSSPERRFRDCDVLLKIVAPHGTAQDRVQAALRDADGVVVVVDAHPSAQEKNRSAFDAVRELIGASGRPDVPVVVQVNKSDLPDAMSAADVVGALDATSFLSVSASAATGEGVVETLAAAVEEVLATLRPEGADEITFDRPTSVAPASAEGHPLLAALRKVLRDTVREHVVELGEKVTAGIETSLARLHQRHDKIEMTLAGLGDRVTRLDGALAKLRGAVDATAVATARLEKLREEVKTEVIRTTETRARADREHLANAMLGLRGSVEGVTDVVAPKLDGVERSLLARTQRLEVTVETLREEVHGKLDSINALVKEMSDELKKPKKGWFA